MNFAIEKTTGSLMLRVESSDQGMDAHKCKPATIKNRLLHEFHDRCLSAKSGHAVIDRTTFRRKFL